MTDITQSAEAPKPKRGRPPKPALRSKQVAEHNEVRIAPLTGQPTSKTVESNGFLGLSPNDCPVDCNVDRCVISGAAYCGHPYKGGLRHSDMNNRAAILQMQEAKRILAHQQVEKKLK